MFIAALEISKAYDKMDHAKLMTSLSMSGLPVSVIKVLFCWYGKLSAMVRWNGSLSSVSYY